MKLFSWLRWWFHRCVGICPNSSSRITYTWGWQRLRAGREGGGRGGDGWIALLIQWSEVWANSCRSRRTGKPGTLQSMGLQRVGHHSATKQHYMCSVGTNYTSVRLFKKKEDLIQNAKLKVFHKEACVFWGFLLRSQIRAYFHFRTLWICVV